MATHTSRVVVASNTYTSGKFTKAIKFNLMLVIYTSDATVGNRQIVGELYDKDDNLVWDSHAGAVQTASLTQHFEWMPGIFRETGFVDGAIQVPFPKDMETPVNGYFKVRDTANISASDDMIISFQYKDVDELYNS